MPWKPPERNWSGIQFEKLRRKVVKDGKTLDEIFNDLHDKLSDCYYNYWKKGLSKPFLGKFDVIFTDGKFDPDKTKKLFDKLHGLIFLIRDVKFHEENLKQAIEERIPEEKYNYIHDEAGNVVDKFSDRAARIIQKLKNEGIEIPDPLGG